MVRFGSAVVIGVFGLTLAGCGSPSYVDRGSDQEEVGGLPGQVVYKVFESYSQKPPACVAVLPFAVPPGSESQTDLRIDQAKTVRRAVYAHLSPQGKKDIELARIDFVMDKTQLKPEAAPAELGAALNCESVLRGRVTEYGSQFLGVYSRVAVGADLQLVRTSNGEILWEGHHVAESHGGSVPLSPIGFAMSMIEAASNVREEQVLRVIDDLARRLVGTIPDTTTVLLDDPVQPKPPRVALKEGPKTPTEFMASISGLHDDECKARLLAAIDDRRFGQDGTVRLYREYLAISPEDAAVHRDFGGLLMEVGDYDQALSAADRAVVLDDADADARFLRGRALLKLDRPDEADASIVEAIARDDSRAEFFNGLGYVNSLRGNTDRALAAYQFAIKRDPVNGFAYYNMGVSFYNLGDLENAADSFYGAGLAYLKSGNYGQVEKALQDLNTLAQEGIDVTRETQTLTDALARLASSKGEKT